MKIYARAVLAGLLALLSLTGLAAGPESCPGADPEKVQGAKDRNLDLVRQFLAETSAPDSRLDDYYFVLIGDIQNSVRDFGHDVFNVIAKNIHEAVDEKTGERLYDKIRFLVLLGDLVYEGPSAREWDWLGRALAGQGPDRTAYPYLELLARDKPIFPAIGNHELLSFRPNIQTHYKDLFDSPLGVVRFKSFFDWDRLIADPHILYPVPADLPEKTFRELSAKLPDPAGLKFLAEQYLLKPDGRYHLKFYENPPLREAEFRAAKDQLAARLAGLFRGAGYGTLPVLNSDNMIHYAFEAGGVVYLILDSMVRGWHYPSFARLKQALYPAQKNRHRLNLFTLSPFNGQSDFYRAVAAYAREHGKALVPMMHSPTFNSSRNIYQTGVGYNTWLALGLPQPGRETGDPTIFDEILFSDVPDIFGACVHAYEHLTVVARSPGKPDHTLQCYISGGGGGPPRRDFVPGKAKAAESLYNQKIMNMGGSAAGRSVEIKDDVTGVGHHYLIVHVAGGRIVDVSPRFIDPKDLHRPVFKPQMTLTASYRSLPSSTGASLEFSPAVWGMERFIKYLTFINWRPSISLGVVNFNIFGKSPDVQAYAATLELSPLTFECHLPRSNVVTLHFPGFEVWDGRGNLRRYFLSMGVEAPLVYDLVGKLENLHFGIKAYIPLHLGGAYDPNFGRRTKLALFAGYRFKL